MNPRSLLMCLAGPTVALAILNLGWGPFEGRIAALTSCTAARATAVPDDDDDDDDDAPSITVEGFREPLDPYGRWIETIRYGWVWHPDEMPDDWRPYSYGHWECTEMGWMFVSEHPWGWACYHYGRWLNTPDNGWIWVPGTVWAPAWVAWRAGGEHIGWAPLPPDPHYHPASTVIVEERSFHLDFVFVAGHRFCEPVRPIVFVPAAHQVNIINQTTNITQVKVVNKTVINNGPQITQVNKFVNKPVTVVKVKDVQKTEIENFHKDVTKVAPERAQRIAITTEGVQKSTSARVEKVQQRSPEVQQRAAMASRKDANDDNRETNHRPSRRSSEPVSIPPAIGRTGAPKPGDRSDKDPFVRTAQGPPRGSGDRPPGRGSFPDASGQLGGQNPSMTRKVPPPPEDSRMPSDPKSPSRPPLPTDGPSKMTKQEPPRSFNTDGKEKKKNKKNPEESPPK